MDIEELQRQLSGADTVTFGEGADTVHWVVAPPVEILPRAVALVEGLGVTRAALAAALGVTRNGVTQMCTKRWEPRTGTLKNFARAAETFGLQATFSVVVVAHAPTRAVLAVRPLPALVVD